MRAATCFSGVGAPEVAMPHWQWLWHAEIEKFPCAVMAARHPQSVNLGDVTAEDFMQRASAFGPIDVLAGGPPCQAFSVAGLRKSMADDRGNLSLRFVGIAHAIRPRNLLVENVPGWLNTKDNAFGCFLGAILGHDDALHSPADGKWPAVGMASGPLGRLCWATLDAQFFGLAQRRKRVFVVVDFGGGSDPVSVLFEPESLCRNPPARGEAGQGVAGTLAARTQGGGGLGTDFDLDGGLHCAEIAPTLNAAFADKQGLEDQHINGGGAGLCPPVSLCLNAGAMGRIDAESETLIPVNRCDFDDADVAHTLRGEGYDASEDGTGRGTPIVPVAYRTSGNCGAWETGDKKDALTTSTDPNSHVIAFSSKDHGADATTDLTPTLRSMSHANGGGQLAVAFAQNQRGELRTSPVAPQLTCGGGKPGEGYPAVAIQAGALRENPASGPDGVGVQSDVAYTIEARAEVQAVAFDMRGREGGAQFEGPHETANMRAASGGSSRSYVAQAWAVRRLTPTECERLQGFPDGYTDIPYRGKSAADGPRYKALGNSWAVPVGRWILDRIERFMPHD